MTQAIASEGCYAILTIKESRVSNESSNVELLNISSRYGNYIGAVVPYSVDLGTAYSLDTYGAGDDLLDRYAFYSPLTLFYETIDQNGTAGGGTIQLTEGLAQVTIPYNGEIQKIKLDTGWGGIDLNADLSEVNCEVTCKRENEGGSYWNDTCCEGLTPATTSADSFTCINCGDGICSPNEDKYSCFEDCSNWTSSGTGRSEPEPKNQSGLPPVQLPIQNGSVDFLPVIFILIIALAAIALFFLFSRKKKSH